MTEPQHNLTTLLEGTYQLALSYYKAEEWSNSIKWLEAVSIYKDANSLLENAQKQLKLASLYEQGQQALDAEDWETARDRFEQVLDIDSNYQDAGYLQRETHKAIKYSQALDQCHSQDWDGAIETLSAILELDPNYRDTPLLLQQARQKKILEEDYQLALRRYTEAERSSQESDWREVVELLQKVTDKEPGYKMVSPTLKRAQTRLEFLELCRKGKEYFDRKKWRKAAKYLKQAYALRSQDSYLTDKCPDLQAKLNEAKAKQKPVMPTLKRLVVSLLASGILITGVTVVFANQFSRIGDSIEKWWREIRATATPTVAIPSIDRIEVWMNGGQLNLDQLPGLTSGEGVVLEVVVFDTNGKRYTSDDLMCKWSVAPLGDEDVGINTDLCKTLYTPSREYSNQTVRFEVGGLGGQFEPSDPISMEFDIITE